MGRQDGIGLFPEQETVNYRRTDAIAYRHTH
jgi:hypothetical protein